MRLRGLLSSLHRGLVVSCQASEDSPLYDPELMAAMALCAERGGAAGLRVNGPDDIAAVRRVTRLPIIGIFKRKDLSSEVYITPDVASAEAVVAAGASIVAVDGTQRPRPGGETLEELISVLKRRYTVLVMADVSTLDEAVAAQERGVDLVATTLSGYTPLTLDRVGSADLQLVADLASALRIPVVAEGRYWTPEQACEAFRQGAHAVVVGSAITNPEAITSRFAIALMNCVHE